MRYLSYHVAEKCNIGYPDDDDSYDCSVHHNDFYALSLFNDIC